MPASKKSDQPIDENRAKYRQRQADKFAWVKRLGADRDLSDAAARALILCAITEAGGKGYWLGKRRHLAEACGMTVRKFDRAIAEGVASNYIRIESDPEDRRANKYYIITINEREMMRERKRQVDEERIRRERHEAEKRCRELAAIEARAAEEFQRPLFNALVAAGYGEDQAYTTARQSWQAHQAGHLPAEMVRKIVALVTAQDFPPPEPWPPAPTDADPSLDLVALPAARPATAGNDHVRDGNDRAANGNHHAPDGNYLAESDQIVAKPEPLNSSDAQSPCASRISRPSRRAIEQDSRTTERAGGAPSVRSNDQPQPDIGSGPILAIHGSAQARSTEAMECDLCDDNGIARNPDGDQIRLLTASDDDNYDAIMEYPFKCQHSKQKNIAALLRIIESQNLYPNWTGYGQVIDGEDEIEEPADIPNTLVSDGNSPEIDDGSNSCVTTAGH